MKRFCLVIVLMQFAISYSFAQCFVNYTESNTSNIVSNEIVSIEFDKVGNLYLCTGRNVSKFDGEEWSYLFEGNMQYETILDMEFCDDNTIWAAGANGVHRFDGSSWISLSTLGVSDISFVSTVAADSVGNIWVGAYEGLFMYDNSVWDKIDFGVAGSFIEVTAIETYYDSIWVGYHDYVSGNGGIAIYDGEFWSTISIPSGESDIYVADILLDDMFIWFATNNGLYRFDGWGWDSFTAENELAGKNVTSIVKDKQGNLWAGTLDISQGQNAGLTRFNDIDFTTYTTADGLLENNIRCIAVDEEGNIWAGSNSKGYFVLRDENWDVYTQQGLCGLNIVYSFIDSNGNKWFSSNDMFSKFDGENWTPYFPGDYVNSSYVHAIGEDNAGNLYFATSEGVTIYDGENWNNIELGQEPNNLQFKDICKDAEGNMWFATFGNGIFVYDGEFWTNVTVEDGLPNNYIRDIELASDGSLWFIINDDVLARCLNQEWTSYSVYPTINPANLFSVASDTAGYIWISTYGQGLLRFKDGEFILFTEDDGLANNYVYNVVVDTANVKWIATISGLQSYNDDVWTTYSFDDGLLPSSVNKISVDSLNHLWIATDSGVSYFGDCNSEFADDFSKDISIQIYPNPANQFLTVSTEKECLSVNIYNLSGQLLKTINRTGQDLQINTSDLSTGLYIVELKTVEGVYRRKITVCH